MANLNYRRKHDSLVVISQADKENELASTEKPSKQRQGNSKLAAIMSTIESEITSNKKKLHNAHALNEAHHKELKASQLSIAEGLKGLADGLKALAADQAVE